MTASTDFCKEVRKLTGTEFGVMDIRWLISKHPELIQSNFDSNDVIRVFEFINSRKPELLGYFRRYTW